MRIAVTKGSLRVPPTYFAVQHALHLADRHDFRLFTMAADVTDAQIAARLSLDDVSQGRPGAGLSFARRERLLPAHFARMQRHIRAFDPMVVHQHFANWATPAYRAARAMGRPLLLTVHGADVFVPLTPLSDRNALGRPMLRWHQSTVLTAFREASRILAVSEYLAGKAVGAGADARKVVVHYQGVDTDLYRPEAAAAAERPSIVAVSALSEAKGTRDLISASIALAADTPHDLVLVGDGPLRAVAEGAAAEHPHIRVLGQLDQAGVRAVYASATVLALPTKQWAGRREAAGLVTLEAQATGAPVVVYDSGGAGEMLSNGETGILVPEGDTAALGSALRDILRLNESDGRALRVRARDWVVAHRSLANSADQLDAHYRELAG